MQQTEINSLYLTTSELESLLANIETLYQHYKQNVHLKNSSYSEREMIEKIKSLYSLKQEKELLDQEIRDYEELLKEVTDIDEQSLFVEELRLLTVKKMGLTEKASRIITDENSTEDNCLIEIRPGAGGIEAGLFARDLFQMYYRFCEHKQWKLEVLENRADSFGNLSFISFLIKGKQAFSTLGREAGVHRVQRVPLTESKGRIQTSTASVVVLPEVNNHTIKIENKDIRIDTYRSSGAGGQHVNTTNSAIRVTHLATGIMAVSQDGRSQHDNKEKALLILRSRLFERYKSEQEGERSTIRSSAIGTGERAEKIRTYNYPQNRLTDHRIGFTVNKLAAIIEGDLDDLCKKLLDFENRKRLLDFIKKVELALTAQNFPNT